MSRLNTVSSQTQSYAFCARCDFGVFSGGKTRKRAVDTHGSRDFGIFFSALWFRIGATGVGGEETGVPTPSSGKLPTASLALRFCGIAIHARARTLARGARVRVRSNFTCNFAVEGAPRRMAGFLIISSCSRPGGILTGNNSTYGNSAIDIARCWKAVDASVDRDETKMELPASRVGHSLSLSFCSRRISSESSDGNAENNNLAAKVRVCKLRYRRTGGGGRVTIRWFRPKPVRLSRLCSHRFRPVLFISRRFD